MEDLAMVASVCSEITVILGALALLIKLLRNPAIRAMFERYGVAIDAAGKKE